MEGLILGIDLCDDYSQISCYNTENAVVETVAPERDSPGLIPTVICKKKGGNDWLIGEEAYRLALFGGGTMVDKILKLTARESFATIEGVRYEARGLLKRYIGKLLELAVVKYSCKNVAGIVYTVQEMDIRLANLLVELSKELGIPADAVHVHTHTESFVYYTLSRPKDVRSNLVSLFDITESGVRYYEMRVIRGRTPQIVEASSIKQEENFSLDVLGNPQGRRMVDSIMTAMAKELFNRKVISSVFLTGRGFVDADWAAEFTKFVCSKRKCFAGQQLFSEGAALAAADYLREKTAYPCVIICEGRVKNTISVSALCNGRPQQVVLTQAGTNWFDAESSAEFIVDDLDEITLFVTTIGEARPEKLKIRLGELPSRPRKTTRISIGVSFTSEKEMSVSVTDRGFGEIFPSSGRVIRREYYL